jgi:hypothetical protein
VNEENQQRQTGKGSKQHLITITCALSSPTETNLSVSCLAVRCFRVWRQALCKRRAAAVGSLGGILWPVEFLILFILICSILGEFIKKTSSARHYVRPRTVCVLCKKCLSPCKSSISSACVWASFCTNSPDTAGCSCDMRVTKRPS